MLTKTGVGGFTMNLNKEEFLDKDIINSISKNMGISEGNIIKEGIVAFLEKKLKEIKSEIYEIGSRYNVASIWEFDELYKKGLVEEKVSWRDYQKLDHLEFKKEQIEKILKELQ